MAKKNVCILFGGKSVEHEISIRSAVNVFENIDKETYSVSLIGINKSGKWFLMNKVDGSFLDDNELSIKIDSSNPLFTTNSGMEFSVDIIFPVLHGTDGEDGSVQGMLECLNIPYVGSEVLGSSMSMNKAVTKKILRQSNLPVAKGLELTKGDAYNLDEIIAEIGIPLIVKPSNLGSSVGVSKVSNKEELATAISLALKYDNQILIEEFITGREMECAILGNENPLATPPGEIVLKGDHEVYSYDAKYEDELGTDLLIPASVESVLEKKIQDLCIKAFQALNCKDLARVDFFIKEDQEIVINEINTIPGFTSISMYPKLCELIGVNYQQLISKLLEMALARHTEKQSLMTSIR